MLSFLYVDSDHSILECYNLFSAVELSMRSFFVISQGNEIKVKVIAPFLFFKFWLYNKTQRSFANTVIEKEGKYRNI